MSNISQIMKVQYIFALLINYAASVAAVGSYHPTASFTQTKPLVFRKWHGSYWDIQLLKKGDVDEIRCAENSTQIVCNPGWVRAYGMRYSIGYMLDNQTCFPENRRDYIDTKTCKLGVDANIDEDDFMTRAVGWWKAFLMYFTIYSFVYSFVFGISILFADIVCYPFTMRSKSSRSGNRIWTTFSTLSTLVCIFSVIFGFFDSGGSSDIY